MESRILISTDFFSSHDKSSCERSQIFSQTRMDPAQCATVASALPEEPHRGMASVLLPEETVSEHNPDAKGYMKRKNDDASIGDVASNKDGTAHTQVNGPSSEASTAPALINDEAATKFDVNADNKDTALETDGGLTGDSITSDAVNGAPDNEDAVNGDSINGDAVNRESINGDTINGDSDMKSKLSPIPLTNGHLEEPVHEPSEGVPFDDIWSPATKLKRRLEDTKDLIVCPGVYDGFSARIALSVGFDAMYMVMLRFLL